MQNIISANSKTMTMSSREIAELLESNHSDVRRSIERLGNRGVITLPPLAEVSNEGAGPKTIGVYQLCKRDSLIVVAQLCPEFTAKIVDRWQELEAKSAFALPQSFAQALMLAAQQAEQIEKQQAALAIAAPKAEALDRMTLADGEVCLQTAGKLLQQRPNKFIEWLRSLGTWIFKRQGGRISAYTDKINAGYLNVRSTTTIMPDGSERVREQVVVTPKGLAKLAMLLGVQPEMIGGIHG